MAGSLTVSGLASGLASGSKTIGPLSMQGAATVGTVMDVTLVPGDNVIPIPTGAVAAVIVFALTGVPAITLRTDLNEADTGLPLARSGWMVYPLASGTSYMVLSAGGATTVEVSFI